jgi:16S rRNA (guanine527-N7)-methyltransferase
VPRPLADSLAATIAADRTSALALLDVSRETLERLEAFVAFFLQRQEVQNLVSAASVAEVWSRHVIDSLQLQSVLPEARTWVDIGSGAGFPGVVLACALADLPGAHVDMIESHQRKAAFLAEAIERIGLPARVHVDRIEKLLPGWRPIPDAVTARAVASLDKLLTWTAPLLQKGAKGVFPKGQHVASELTEASKSWRIDLRRVPSVTRPDATILVIDSVSRRK